MGLIDRLKRITLGRIEAFLDSVERPEEALPQIVREMQGRLKQAANAEAKSLAALRGARRKLDEANGRIARLAHGAELAVQAQQDDLAARALAAQIEAEAGRGELAQSVERAETAYQGAHDVRTRLQRDLTALKAKKADLLARLRTARARERAQRATANAPASGGDLLDAVARMEDRVAEREEQVLARDEVYRLLDRALLDELPADALRTEEVQRRLDDLRTKRQGKGATSEQDTPGNDTPDRSTPRNNTPGSSTSGSDTRDNNTPGSDTPDNSTPGQRPGL